MIQKKDRYTLLKRYLLKSTVILKMLPTSCLTFGPDYVGRISTRDEWTSRTRQCRLVIMLCVLCLPQTFSPFILRCLHKELLWRDTIKRYAIRTNRGHVPSLCMTKDYVYRSKTSIFLTIRGNGLIHLYRSLYEITFIIKIYTITYYTQQKRV